ncbi:MarR family winged helix-turn-helix transcriptional regulator [Nocardioides terrisoli]|uniref:MarR family winged helix-turn-helix transcriptional regulator n=1 Tax=Nocardioides terrisoli TaxID=3388267 RepID=UPI00287B5E10|nr:MarR family transcriptional regulator [Nocardioides marmorisolisilvae]
MPKSLQVLLRDAHAAVDAEVAAAATRAGFSELNPGHHVVLRNLGELGARPSEMAAAAGVTRQAITKVVDDLERRGVVRREPDPVDGRGVVVRYTERGLEGLAVARRRMAAMEADFSARIGADRWAEVRIALEILFPEHPKTPHPR